LSFTKEKAKVEKTRQNTVFPAALALKNLTILKKTFISALIRLTKKYFVANLT